MVKNQAKRAKEKNQSPKNRLNKRQSNKNQLSKVEQKKVVPLKKPGKKQAIIRKERPNYLKKIKDFLRGVNYELKKVHWLTRREVAVYTVVVLAAVAVVGMLLWIFDSFLSFFLQLIMK